MPNAMKVITLNTQPVERKKSIQVSFAKALKANGKALEKLSRN